MSAGAVPADKTPRRGRPPKFGRPGRLVALTLPEDVLDRLRAIDPDPAWAIVKLCDGERPHDATGPATPDPLVEIALLDRRQGLIVVDRRGFSGLPGVALIPLSSSRAFLALESGGGLAELELAVVDRLDEGVALPDRNVLLELRRKLREWRNDPQWRFQNRSIIVAEQTGSLPRRRGGAGRKNRSL